MEGEHLQQSAALIHPAVVNSGGNWRLGTTETDKREKVGTQKLTFFILLFNYEPFDVINEKEPVTDTCHIVSYNSLTPLDHTV